MIGWSLGVPTPGDRNEGGWVLGYGRLCPEEEENCRTVYLDTDDYRPLREDDAEVGGMSS